MTRTYRGPGSVVYGLVGQAVYEKARWKIIGQSYGCTKDMLMI